MKPKIIVCDGMSKDAFRDLCAIEQFDVHPEPKVKPETLDGLLPDATALVIRSATKVTADILEKAPGLKYVIRAGEGTDNIDKVSCGQKDVKVSNTPGANNNSAAEHAIALMMTVLRKTAWAHQKMRDGGWDKNLYTGLELWKKKVAVIGFGRIGQIVAKRLAGFEPEIRYYDPFVEKTDIPYATREEHLNALFSWADIITVHTPLMDATRNLIDRKLLTQMQPHAILVHAARGGIVNEQDLLSVLHEGKIRGATLDVFETEPLAKQSPLRQLPNLVLTPHLGASTEEAQNRVGEMAVHQLKEFFINNNLLNEVRA
jgi:D-3-phosphoglycerate dehydrogenase